MIEIRTFEGTPQEMSAFCTGAWRERYAATRMPVPRWTPEFLEWELFTDEPGSREFLVAAYDGTRLVGLLPAKPTPFHLRGEPFEGSLGSYFSVDPAYRTHGVALKLNLEQCRRHRQREAKFCIGYVYLGAGEAKGKEFWLRLPRNFTVVRKLGLWVRMLDHRAVAAFEHSVRDRWAARLLGTFQRSPRPQAAAPGIRPYRPDDLEPCLPLAERIGRDTDLGCVWTRDALSRQLAFKNVPKTLVAEQQGRVAGFLNYCHLEFEGRAVMKAGVIDLLSIGELRRPLARRLLRAALGRMVAEGCHVALLPRIACYPVRPLLRAGFIPAPADYYLTAQAMHDAPFPADVRRLHVRWR